MSASETFVPLIWAALKSAMIACRAATTGTVRRLTAQSFWGARARRPPLAPPRLSLLRWLPAAEKAVKTRSDGERPAARILPFSAAMAAWSITAWSSGGIGSCHSRPSSSVRSAPR